MNEVGASHVIECRGNRAQLASLTKVRGEERKGDYQ